MSYHDTVVQLNDYRRQIAGIRSEMRALQAWYPETQHVDPVVHPNGR